MNKKVTLKDIAIMQSGIYMKTDSQGEVRYLQVKDVNSENKLDYTQIATVINTGINDKHWLKNGDLLFAAKGGKTESFTEQFLHTFTADIVKCLVYLPCTRSHPEVQR